MKHYKSAVYPEDICSRTIEILQRALIFKANQYCCLKVKNAPLKLAAPISG